MANHPANPSPPATLIELLQSMIRFDTVNSSISGRPDAERALADWLEQLAVEWGLGVRRLPIRLSESDAIGAGVPVVMPTTPQLLVDFVVDDNAPWLLFESHLDTVAVDGMTIDPFAGELRDDRVFGRGACDTKGTGAAMLWALKQYADAQRATQQKPASGGGHNIALLFTVDEEITMIGARSFAAHDAAMLRAEMGLDPIGVVVGEPTLLQPVTAHNGVVRWRLTTRGRAVHSSVPHMGRNAISDMVRLIDAVEARYIGTLDQNHPMTGRAASAVTTIAGGHQVNIVPDHCVVDIDRRFLPTESAEDADRQLRDVLASVAEAEADIRYELEQVRCAPSLSPTISEAFLPQVQAVLTGFGLPTKAIGAPFATDAGDLAATASLPAIVLGPGDPMPAHTEDEWVDVEQIELGAEVYHAIMQGEPAKG